MAKDILGRKLDNGNVIAYPVMRHGKMDTKLGVVTAVFEDRVSAKTIVDKEGKLKVRRINLDRTDRIVKIRPDSLRMVVAIAPDEEDSFANEIRMLLEELDNMS